MKKLDRFLELSQQTVLDTLNSVYSIRSFWKALGLGTPLRRGRGLTEFEDHFNIDISKAINSNIEQQKKDKLTELMNQDRVCKNPKCLKHFTWNQHPYSLFCSVFCSHSYAASNRTLQSKQKTSKSVSKEHLHVCPRCGKKFMHKGTCPNALCLECKSRKLEKEFQSVNRQKRQKNFFINEEKNEIVKLCPICGDIKGQCLRPEICLHPQRFKRYIQFLGFDPNTLGTIQVYEEYDRIQQQIYDLYWNQKLSIQQIKDLTPYKSSVGSFAIMLNYLISFRNSSDAIKNAISCGRIKPAPFKSRSFKSGFHTTWDGKVFFLRSSYEEEYAKDLDSQKIEYEVETLQIKYYDSQLQKERFAFPDFYIPSKNLIVEVKSEWTLDKKNMLDKFLEYKRLGYNVDLLYEHQHYNDLLFFGF